ncbi:uncharacterized protein EAE98_008218 [Botrytis deweyae]|uniref:Zn(2)-C6 fungal-type domain-containing protein n=1 Tax=Botrytis deweyae TaxID=2478750 RepID=A0ABQ7IFL0_9HELO|nr:uncharacterized protein EAE98_008218 [Botrytis deweyae]KAF7922007.1 hypothetical protein EAE98_008218 [Botrytis deweyae]
MYGTLSFGNGSKSKRSSAEFHTFSAFHRRRLRQPACDECRTARVKCRWEPDSENLKCARCQGSSRACTYNSASCRSRNPHSGKPTEPRERTRTASVTVEGNEDENRSGNRNGKGSSLVPSIPESASSPSPSPSPSPPSIPQGPTVPQDTHTRWWESQFEPLDLFFDPDPATDKAIDGSPNLVPPNRVDADVSSASMNDNDGVLHLPELELASKSVEHNAPHYYDFSAPGNELRPNFSLPTPSLSSTRTPSPTPSLVWSTMIRHAEHQKRPSLSSDVQIDPPATLQPKHHTQDDTTQPSSRAGFSDLIDVMRFAKNPSPPASATLTPSTCTCLQDLTATLFSLRRRPEKAQVDQFLLLFTQAMSKWEAVETCTSARHISQSLALLMLMNIQELVALLLDASSSVNAADSPSGGRDSILAINIGTFTVEDGADQRIIAQMLLAVRMKELYSFITRMSAQMKLAGFDDICMDYHHQTEIVRRAVTS